ncbi:MAG TPA: HD domain-containing protein [Spirochaetota bacterium]|nr:HD domain-containing protein [Spirochaetota bacterium]HOS32497.1 HD domain-containing protein [Spirochaetota bacterium]HOS56015.1 HD domain-containing protein [Spirochaetota bacterium]HPK61058.1 HD domain-containing protein [Spirochaetota bacterium]HQF76740.1 HD domain-containing protein [Spirochaetota bacterium]
MYAKTLMFAAERHKDQKIKDKNVSYIVHLSLVAMELINLFATVKGFDEDYAIQTALLHDVIEDTDAQYSDVEKHFGGEIADGVLALTKDYSLPKEAQMKDSVARILKQPREISLVKMSDRISNLNPPPVSWDKEKIKNYYEEAIFIYDSLHRADETMAQRLREKTESYKRFL